jgi:hypothetical protein
MTWATTVGVDGRQRQATTWVMTRAMTWVMGMMAATALATMLAKGMVGMPAGRGGGGLLAEDAAVVAVAATAAAAVVAATTAAGMMAAGMTAAAGTAAAAAAYCRGCLHFTVKTFLCGFLCVGGIGKVTPCSPHTLVKLEVYRRTFGWGQ